MTLRRADRVWETSTSSGTGAKVLAGAKDDYRAISSITGMVNGDTIKLTIVEPGVGWEFGLYTYNSGANSISISGSPYSSSNAGAVVNFSGTALDIYCDEPADFFDNPIPAAMMPALTGDVTNSAGSLATSVAKINGAALGTTTATSGNLLVGSGTAWQSVAMSGDATLNSSGAITVSKTGGVSFAAIATSGSASDLGSGTLPSARISAVGTPASGNLSNCTALPVSTGISGFGTGIATFLATPSSANLLAALTDETGTGPAVFAGSPAFTGTVTGSAVTWSGINTAASFIPTSSTIPANGMYLPAANALGLATNTTERMRILSNGVVGVGTSTPTVGMLEVLGGNAFTNLPPNGTAAFGHINSTTGWDGSGFLFTNSTTGSSAFSMVYNGDVAYFGGVTSSTGTVWVRLSAGILSLDATNSAFQIHNLNALRYPTNDSTEAASIAIGASALAGQSGSSAAYSNTGVGYQVMAAGTLTTAAIKNVALGFQAANGITTGHDNVCIGYQAGQGTTVLQTGFSNVLIGSGSHTVNSGSNSAVAIGSATAANSSGIAIGANANAASANTIIVGANAGNASLGANCTGVGNLALANATGAGNSTLGDAAGDFISSGTNNTFLGFNAGKGITGTKITGSGNTAVGKDAGLALQGAAGTNTLIGISAGASVTSGAGNTIIGNAVGSTTLTTGTNNILIGVSSAITTAAAGTNNTIHIGGTGGDFITVTGTDVNTTALVTMNGAITLPNLAGSGSRTVLADANGLLSAPVSDARVKENIMHINYGLKEVMSLRPVSFDYIAEFKSYGMGRQIGLIAQEVEKIVPEVVGFTTATGKKSLDYAGLLPVLIHATQEQQQIICALEKRLTEMENKYV